MPCGGCLPAQRYIGAEGTRPRGRRDSPWRPRIGVPGTQIRGFRVGLGCPARVRASSSLRPGLCRAREAELRRPFRLTLLRGPRVDCSPRPSAWQDRGGARFRSEVAPPWTADCSFPSAGPQWRARSWLSGIREVAAMCEVGLRLLRPQKAILHSRAAARYPIFRSVEQFSGTVQIWRCTIFFRSTVQCRNRGFYSSLAPKVAFSSKDHEK